MARCATAVPSALTSGTSLLAVAPSCLRVSSFRLMSRRCATWQRRFASGQIHPYRCPRRLARWQCRFASGQIDPYRCPRRLATWQRRLASGQVHPYSCPRRLARWQCRFASGHVDPSTGPRRSALGQIDVAAEPSQTSKATDGPQARQRTSHAPQPLETPRPGRTPRAPRTSLGTSLPAGPLPWLASGVPVHHRKKTFVLKGGWSASKVPEVGPSGVRRSRGRVGNVEPEGGGCGGWSL